MRRLGGAIAAAVLAGALHAQNVQALLSRVAEEAEVFQQNAPKALTQETLEQRAVMPPARFKPRIGQAADQVRQPRMQVREIVSEYSIAPLANSDAGNLVELRQVTSVD